MNALCETFGSTFNINLVINFVLSFQMTALKQANKELKGMMKTVKIQDIDVCNFMLSLYSSLL